MTQFSLRVLLLLSLGHCITDIYQGGLPALLPFLKEKLALSYTMTGVIMILANTSGSVLQPLFGYLSDKKEKAFLLPLGVLASGAGFAALSIPSSYLLLLLFVTVSGLVTAGYHPEGYKTAHFFTGKRAVTGMAIFSVGGNFGFALGPLLTVYLVKYMGLDSLPVIVIPALAFAATLVYLRKTLAIPRTGERLKQKESAAPVKGAYLSVLLLVCVVIMRSWTQMGLMSYIPFYYINFLRGDPLYAGKLVSIFLLGGVVGTLGGAPLADRWGHRRFIRTSMFLTSLILPFVLYCLQGGASTITLSVMLFVLGVTLVSTFSVTVVMAQWVLPKNLGIASGLMVGFAIGAGGIGVTLLGVVADHFGVVRALQSIAVLPVAAFIFSMILRYPAQRMI